VINNVDEVLLMLPTVLITC